MSLPDGFALFRFAHAFSTGGGVERYLDDIDTALLERHAIDIVRMQFADPDAAPDSMMEPERIGRGRLLRVPMRRTPQPEQSNPVAAFSDRLRSMLRNHIISHPLIWKSVGARFVQNRRIHPRPGEIPEAGTRFSSLCENHDFRLGILHFFGARDAEDVILQMRRRQIPVLLLNHFSNDRLRHLAVRKHAMLADGVAGVTGRGVPPELRNRFLNLGDGIDTRFFSPESACPPADAPPLPIVLLPSRLVPEKGHADLLRAAHRLRNRAPDFCIAFVGRTDSDLYRQALERLAQRFKLAARVRFLGPLPPAIVRDWMAASTAVVLPSVHHEGLPRVLIEAQGTGTPVIAYDSGGAAEAVAEGETGFVIPPRDVRALAYRISDLLRSPEKRRTLGVAARSLAVSCFSLDKLIERHEAAIARFARL